MTKVIMIITSFIFFSAQASAMHIRTVLGVEVFMTNNIVSPLSDFAFARIFGEQRNIDNTKAFLKTLLDIPGEDYEQLTIVSPILGRFFKQDKTAIVDLKLSTKSGRIIHIEIQVEKKSNFRSRILYYAAKLIEGQLKFGDNYDKLHQVISIVICDHDLLEEEDSYINEYELRNKKDHLFTNLLKIVILELPKLPKEEDSDVWRWLRFLKCQQEEEFEMLKRKYPELEKPISCAKKMSLFEQWRDIQFHKRLWKMDQKALFLQARMNGEDTAKLNVARKLLEEGSTPEFIHKITGLDLEIVSDVEKIDKKIAFIVANDYHEDKYYEL